MLRLGHCNNLVPNSSRLGCSNQTKMHFNLHHLIQKHDLHQIEAPFTKEDIDNIVKKMPLDKAPGSDGFNASS
jgi:Holliday junction resolvase RusA-like endonuclease